MGHQQAAYKSQLINGDHTMFQPWMVAEAYSGEFVLRLCLLGAFHCFIHIFFNKRNFIKN